MAVLVADGMRAEGYDVDIAHDGGTALALASAAGYDLLLLDVMLPGLDGFELCRRLRALRSDVAVLMVTARGAVEDRVNGLDVGADDYLVKPFAMEELRARVRALARRGPSRHGATLRVGNLDVDPLRYEARRGGQLIELTAREFRLLAFLVRRAGEVVTRSEILDAIWGEEAEQYGNVVDQYIHYLRAKTERYGPRLIETVRGAGYILRGSEAPCSERSA
jgi:two-component system OmpR family response regulator